MLSIAVCDDEMLDCCNIARNIRDILEEMQITCIIRQFYNGKELLHAAENMFLTPTMWRRFKEARRKGDTATMERAMGYVNEFEDKAEQYKTEADAGMQEDAKAAREKAEAELEKAIEKRKAERKKLEEKIEESREAREDKVEISEDGKALLKENTNSDNIDLDNPVSIEIKAETADGVKDPVMYTKTGKVNQTEQSVSISISI